MNLRVPHSSVRPALTANSSSGIPLVPHGTRGSTNHSNPHSSAPTPIYGGSPDTSALLDASSAQNLSQATSASAQNVLRQRVQYLEELLHRKGIPADIANENMSLKMDLEEFERKKKQWAKREAEWQRKISVMESRMEHQNTQLEAHESESQQVRKLTEAYKDLRAEMVEKEHTIRLLRDAEVQWKEHKTTMENHADLLREELQEYQLKDEHNQEEKNRVEQELLGYMNENTELRQALEQKCQEHLVALQESAGIEKLWMEKLETQRLEFESSRAREREMHQREMEGMMRNEAQQKDLLLRNQLELEEQSASKIRLIQAECEKRIQNLQRDHDTQHRDMTAQVIELQVAERQQRTDCNTVKRKLLSKDEEMKRLRIVWDADGTMNLCATECLRSLLLDVRSEIACTRKNHVDEMVRWRDAEGLYIETQKQLRGELLETQQRIGALENDHAVLLRENNRLLGDVRLLEKNQDELKGVEANLLQDKLSLYAEVREAQERRNSQDDELRHTSSALMSLRDQVRSFADVCASIDGDSHHLERFRVRQGTTSYDHENRTCMESLVDHVQGLLRRVRSAEREHTFAALHSVQKHFTDTIQLHQTNIIRTLNSKLSAWRRRMDRSENLVRSYTHVASKNALQLQRMSQLMEQNKARIADFVAEVDILESARTQALKSLEEERSKSVMHQQRVAELEDMVISVQEQRNTLQVKWRQSEEKCTNATAESNRMRQASDTVRTEFVDLVGALYDEIKFRGPQTLTQVLRTHRESMSEFVRDILETVHGSMRENPITPTMLDTMHNLLLRSQSEIQKIHSLVDLLCANSCNGTLPLRETFALRSESAIDRTATIENLLTHNLNLFNLLKRSSEGTKNAVNYIQRVVRELLSILHEQSDAMEAITHEEWSHLVNAIERCATSWVTNVNNIPLRNGGTNSHHPSVSFSSGDQRSSTSNAYTSLASKRTDTARQQRSLSENLSSSMITSPFPSPVEAINRTSPHSKSVLMGGDSRNQNVAAFSRHDNEGDGMHIRSSSRHVNFAPENHTTNAHFPKHDETSQIEGTSTPLKYKDGSKQSRSGWRFRNPVLDELMKTPPAI